MLGLLLVLGCWVGVDVGGVEVAVVRVIGAVAVFVSDCVVVVMGFVVMVVVAIFVVGAFGCLIVDLFACIGMVAIAIVFLLCVFCLFYYNRCWHRLRVIVLLVFVLRLLLALMFLIFVSGRRFLLYVALLLTELLVLSLCACVVYVIVARAVGEHVCVWQVAL